MLRFLVTCRFCFRSLFSSWVASPDFFSPSSSPEVLKPRSFRSRSRWLGACRLSLFSGLAALCSESARRVLWKLKQSFRTPVYLSVKLALLCDRFVFCWQVAVCSFGVCNFGKHLPKQAEGRRAKINCDNKSVFSWFGGICLSYEVVSCTGSKICIWNHILSFAGRKGASRVPVLQAHGRGHPGRVSSIACHREAHGRQGA